MSPRFSGPGLAMWWLFLDGGLGSASRLAVCCAVLYADVVVVSQPSAATVSPRAAMIHQQGWVGCTKAVVIRMLRPVPTVAPSMATPRVMPTWRLVVATAEATPAWEGGIPATA